MILKGLEYTGLKGILSVNGTGRNAVPVITMTDVMNAERSG